MAPRSNREILTGGKKYVDKAKQKHRVEEVKFDKESRKDYLTGFHKRKVARQKKAQDFNKEQARLQRIEDRKEVRDERKRDMENQLKLFNETMKRISNLNDLDSEDEGEEEKEWQGFDDQLDGFNKEVDVNKPKLGVLQHKEVYAREHTPTTDAIIEEETTVEIELMENPAIKEAQEIQRLAKQHNVDLSKSEEVLEDSLKKAKQVAVILGVAKPKPKLKKKFRYLTKAERRDNNRKAKEKKSRK